MLEDLDKVVVFYLLSCVQLGDFNILKVTWVTCDKCSKRTNATKCYRRLSLLLFESIVTLLSLRSEEFS